MSDQVPPPFVPPVPVADGGSGAGGESKLWLLVGSGVLAAIVVVTLLVGGDDDGDDPVTPTPESELVEGMLPDATPEEARCVQDEIAAAIERGVVSEEPAMGEVLSFLDECGISLDEIVGEQGG